MDKWKHFQVKEEKFSWLGGKIFMVRWKDFRGKEETFSRLGGKKIMAKFGSKTKRGKIFMVPLPAFFRNQKGKHGDL